MPTPNDAARQLKATDEQALAALILELLAFVCTKGLNPCVVADALLNAYAHTVIGTGAQRHAPRALSVIGDVIASTAGAPNHVAPTAARHIH
ncbi:hypothetical protein [Acidovorax sp.]|uniref:hypothetical protein n=1 Tax=Acidovorax sp. TaxID=1872122 RepID=UPI002ACE1083|nr:hypothetical protein [Acidovorax sp.]MDZ7862639.1 hypothetical protein [Acidovorax sp.]